MAKNEAWENGCADGHAIGRALLREMAGEDLPFRFGDHVARLVGRPLTAIECGFLQVFAEAAIDSARSRYPAP